MNERRTMSILQRVTVVLAVTAASYGLRLKGKPKLPEGDAMPFKKLQPRLLPRTAVAATL